MSVSITTKTNKLTRQIEILRDSTHFYYESANKTDVIGSYISNYKSYLPKKMKKSLTNSIFIIKIINNTINYYKFALNLF